MSESSLVHSLGDLSLQNPPRTKTILWIISLTAIAITIFSYFIFYLPVRNLFTSARSLQAEAARIPEYLKNQDLGGAQNQLGQVKSRIDETKRRLTAFSWTKVIPYFGNYYRDGLHGLVAAEELVSAGELGIQAIAPYADVIGLKGISGTGDGAKTAQDRINLILETIEKISPQLDQIGAHLSTAKKEADQVDPNRYPKTLKGTPLRAQISSSINLLDQASSLINDAQPFIESAPYILGMEKPRKYLVIFQNDAELRPTGGFMTAYAVISVDKGKINIMQSDDIYSLDAKFPGKIEAPEAIKKYLPKVPYWYIRDQNLSPDFKVSMDTFFPNYLKTKSPAVDGIISLDTQVLVDLLKITGPIGVSGFGNYSAEEDKRCNCPQVFYELEKFADVEGPVVWDSISGQIIVKPKNYGERKSFIGPMMYSVLTNVMAQPKSKMVDLFNTTMSLLQAKHIQFYFTESQIQSAVEAFNLAGRIRDFDGDYLLVVDTNFAGAKTNAWVTYTADQKIDVSSDGTITKTLTLTYKNPQAYFEDKETKLRLNGLFRDWLRVYVPKGSKLIEAKGFETGQTTGEDLGKTVFEGFFTLTPLNVKTVTFKYELPFKVKSPYKLLIQKQGGSKSFPYNIIINGSQNPEFLLSSDKELSLPY